ncbi:flippase [Mucilaginibacter myungsuensis]|uniref:Flippase n=1 Tax=Mucilaginibacter myungsuensis TaxID=649104 RepID=A0A929KYY5_9SPHI|nr:flippase [Mucilaginibacter myungsuensis]MBE9663747.1 flippase [Mucilaginibacter myungsuensis]MDN3598930.1 flippase [Mucilaginibacter myungsuensis]
MIIANLYKKLRSITDIKRLAINAFWLFFDRFLRLGVGLIVGVWVARYLGPLSFGKLNYAAALVALMSALSTLGLDQVIIKKIIDDPSSKFRFLGTAFFLRTVGGMIALGICCSYVAITDSDRTLLIITLIVSLSPIFSCFDVIDYEFQANLQSKKTVIAKNTAFMIASALKSILIIKGFSLTIIVIAIVSENFLGLLGLIMFYGIKNVMQWRIKYDLIIGLLKECWPLILSSIIVLLYMRVDQIMIDNFAGHNAVGEYSVSVRVTELWYFIPMILTSTLYPRLVNLYDDKERYYKLVSFLLKVLFFISFSIALVVNFFSVEIVTMLFGQVYKEAAFALNISIWTGVFVFWGVGVNNILVIENLNIHNFKKSVLGLSINIILNFLFIPRYGINGAAIATLISQFFASYLYFAFQRSTRHIFYLQSRSILFFIK